jgi:hypothetical protein
MQPALREMVPDELGSPPRPAEEKRKAENRKRLGPVPRPPSKEPDPKAQRNFSDPDNRVLLTKDGFIQGYNAQAAVDGAKPIILAHGLTQSTSVGRACVCQRRLVHEPISRRKNPSGHFIRSTAAYAR